MVEQNSRQVEQRDEEIRRIVESIAELQSIFSDLANLVADQGTVLDRIDYNMEQTVVKVDLELMVQLEHCHVILCRTLWDP